MMVDVTRRGLGLATLMTAAHSRHKHPKGHAMPTPSTLRATVQQDGTTAGQSAIVLVDGADTMVTANGVAGYVPMQDDRVLVQQVGGQVEIIQFLNRTYITGQTLRTAASGQRWEITSGLDFAHPDTIAGYSGLVAEINPAKIEVLSVSGHPELSLSSPTTAAHPTPSTVLLEGGTVQINGASMSLNGDVLISGSTTLGPLFLGIGTQINAINFGNVNVTFAGGVSTATTGSIAHGLPSTPLYVGVMPNAATSAYYGYLAGGLTSTNFNLGAKNAVTNPAAGTVVNLLWFAIC